MISILKRFRTERSSSVAGEWHLRPVNGLSTVLSSSVAESRVTDNSKGESGVAVAVTVAENTAHERTVGYGKILN